MTEPATALAPPQVAGVPVLYHDDLLIVCDKPAGLLAVPGRGEAGHDCVVARLQQCFADAQTVHRLDMSTSGLMVHARGKAAQRQLSMAFAARSVHKRYVAVVHGQLQADDWQQVDLPLIVDWPNRPRQKVDFEAGKPSLTRYRVLSHDPAGDTTRVLLEPVTGRSHQLRVHLMSIGHPIVGDELYAGPHAQGRLLLHASELAFDHPLDGRRMAFASEPPF